jgi:hypothetical protein
MNLFVAGFIAGFTVAVIAGFGWAVCLTASRADKNLEQQPQGENENQA